VEFDQSLAFALESLRFGLRVIKEYEEWEAEKEEEEEPAKAAAADDDDGEVGAAAATAAAATTAEAAAASAQGLFCLDSFGWMAHRPGRVVS
jgi:phosphoglucomutase